MIAFRSTAGFRLAGTSAGLPLFYAAGYTSGQAEAVKRFVAARVVSVVGVVDPMTLKVIAKMPVGPDPHEVVASSDGRTAYISNYNGGGNIISVVDLVGILNPERQHTFQSVHVELARKVVAACRICGVSRLLHVSALNADPAGPSAYLRSKGEAENIVAASGLSWTIFQPSVIFGREDSFLNLFARLHRLMWIIPLAAAHARFQPVYVADVAAAIVHSLRDDATHNQRYPLCGPKIYTLEEIVRYVGEHDGIFPELAMARVSNSRSRRAAPSSRCCPVAGRAN